MSSLPRSFYLIRTAASTAATGIKDGDYKPFSAIPGPKGLPLVGNSKELSANVNRIRLYYAECFEEYGDIFKLKIPGQ